jgi:hypothetical protein
MDLRVAKQDGRTGTTEYLRMLPDGSTAGVLNRAHVTAYWRSVQSILRLVFERKDAETLVRNIRRRLRKAGPPAAHALFYHASPLHVAADLAGIDGPLTEAQESRGAEIQGTGLA